MMQDLFCPNKDTDPTDISARRVVMSFVVCKEYNSFYQVYAT